MEKPVLTPEFTVEDIHKIREYNYERTKNLSDSEKIEFNNKNAYKILEKIFPSERKVKIA